ncbi:MAG: cell division protein ZipA C-terminal FtsZ-binding domain-containing protein [Chromatiales bacterium]|jgi:cell division protein ZipA
MTSGELRLLILVLGLLFIAAVYLWERHRRTRVAHGKRREHSEAFDDPDSLTDQINELDELVTSREKSIPYIQAATPHFEERTETQSEPVLFVEDDFEPEAEIHSQQLNDTILIISVASNKKYFSGDAIMSAMRVLNLVPGPLDVFYRYDENQENILFTVASMVEPGTFPIQDMSRFTTSGLTLFGRLPSARSGPEILEDMYETGQQLAAQLDGKLLDSQHQPLSEETFTDMQKLANAYVAQSG